MNVIIFPQLESQQEIPSVDLSNVLSVSSSSSSDRNISFPLSYLFEIGDLPIDPVSSSCVQSRSSFHPPHPSISTITCTKWSSVRLPISCIRQQHSRWVYTLMQWSHRHDQQLHLWAWSVSIMPLLIIFIERQVNRELFSNGILRRFWQQHQQLMIFLKKVNIYHVNAWIEFPWL